MYVGAGIGQQNPSRHLPALSSASGLSPSTVRPSQGWAALPHHLAPSLAHAWRDEEHAESRPSHPVSRQCHPQCSGLPRALGDMGLAQGTAGLAGAGGWTSGHPWAQTADGWDRWTRDRRTRHSGQDVQPGDAGQRGRAQWAAPRRGLCWRRWKGAWPAAARLAVGRVAAAGPHDGSTQWRQRAPPSGTHGRALLPQPKPPLWPVGCSALPAASAGGQARLAVAVHPVTPGSVGHPHRPTHVGFPTVRRLLQHRETVSQCLRLWAFPFPAANGCTAPLAQQPALQGCHRGSREPAATSSPSRGRPRAGETCPGRSAPCLCT